jgi:hypothetical protein
MTTYIKVVISFEPHILELTVKPNTTVFAVIKEIRKRYKVGIFESLELLIDGNHVDNNECVSRIGWNSENPRIECIRRKFFGFC